MRSRSAPFLVSLALLLLLPMINASAAERATDESASGASAESVTDDEFEKVLLTSDVAQPMTMDIANDGRVFVTSRDGVVRIYHPETGELSVAAELRVFDDHPLPPDPDIEGSKNQEGGLLGLALDPDFDTNGWVYVYYTSRDENNHFLSRFMVEDGRLDVESEIVLLKVPYDKTNCCHVAGDLEFDSAGNLYLSTGDEATPDLNDQYSPLDSRSTHWYNDDRRTSGNTNDLRGKILRITPQADGTYTIPEGNLFTGAEEGGGKTRPEIYAMGFRNPFRISIDPATDRLHIGNYGPDRLGDWTERGPWGFDQYMVTSEPANFGYPFCIGNNYPYRPWDYETNEPLGDFYDCENGPINDSPNNTGLERTPPVKPATIYYPRSWTGWPQTWEGWPGRDINPIPEPFLEMGSGAGGPMSGPVYRYDENLGSPTKFPESYDGRWFLLDYHRGHVKTAVLDENETVTAIDDFMPGQTWSGLMDGQFGPDGSLYVLEGGSFGDSPNAGLYRIDYVGGDGPNPDCATQPAEDGYRPLWDGATLNGWNQAGPGGFAVVPDEDRPGACALESVGDPEGLGMLWHGEEFDSYRLHVDFKAVAEDDNSGVFIGFPDPGDDPWIGVQQGYEIQIDDTGGSPDAADKSKTGSIYTFQAPTSFPTVAGEWNTMEIEVDDPMIRVWINDVLVNEYENPEGSGRDLSSGYVGLQNNRVTDTVYFRDVWIKELGEDQCPEPQTPPEGFVPLFDGETLDGWTQAGPGGFEVDECGLLQPHGGMGLLWYDQKTFDDFTMRVDFRVQDPADNSGVFVRFPDPQGDPWKPVDEGYEVQIYENTDDPLTRTGAIYTFAPAEPLATNPVGEWNTMEIEAIGQEYRVVLNGTEVATYTGDGSRGLDGYVGIQNHADGQAAGENVEFRNVWIKEHDDRLTVDASLGPAEPDGSGGWYVSPVTLALESNDPEAQLQWRPRTDESEWRTYTEPVVFDEDGIHNIDYRAVVPGGEPSEKEILVGPNGFDFSETEFSVRQNDVVKFQYVPGYPHDVVITDENGEILASRPLGSDWEDDPFYFEATEQGTYYVYCTPHSNRPDPDDPTTWTGMVSTFEVTPADDGEETGIEEIEFLIDRTVPATEATVEGTQDGDAFTGPVTVTLGAQDATSGVSRTEYRMGGEEEPSTYEGPLTVDEPGAHTVEFRSVDRAGNAEEWQSVEFTITAGEPGACPDPDTRETVVIGGVDSGVTNHVREDGCSVNDLVLDDAEWRNHGAFVNHVREVTGRLVAEGVLTDKERTAIGSAAARSDIGRGGGPKPV
ncbi:family 16 glycoside hydrolase [Saccharomonospora azurea]